MTATAKPKFTEGPIFFRLLLFTLPIMMSGLLQVAYNMADNIVVGRFSGDHLALSAVGSTGALTAMIVGLLMGIATGAGVVVAQLYGAKEYDRMSRSVHTAMTFAAFSGVALALVLFALARPLLLLIRTKPELLSRAVLYVQIISAGVPATTFYNFGSTVLRSVGDSRTPLIILAVAGIINVGLNFFFVLACRMSVAGVALATVISQYASAIAVIVILMRHRGECYGLDLRRLGIDRRLLAKILRYGLPAGLQSSLFSISNVIITSAVNSLPTTAIYARTVANNVDSLVYTAMNSYLHAAMTFVGQNYGAGKLSRIRKTAIYAVVQVSVIGILLAQLIVLLGEPVVSLFLDPTHPDRAEIAASAMDLMRFFLLLYFLCGVMETLSGVLRGMGNSVAPMVISIAGSCGIRALWVWLFFPLPELNSLNGLYACYPISWGFCVVAMLITLLVTWSKAKKHFRGLSASSPRVSEAVVQATEDGAALPVEDGAGDEAAATSEREDPVQADDAQPAEPIP